jgi:small subunit ribosomal protein S6
LKKYEAVYILDDRRLDDHGDVFVGELTKYIETLGGNVEVAKSLGRKQLASPIRKRNTGVYWDLELNLPEDKLKDLHEHYRLNDTVLRDVVFIFDRPAITQLPKRAKDGDAPVAVDIDDEEEDDN